MHCKQILFLLCTLAVAMVTARPDDGETHPVPGPGLAYGGIPYGSMSGNLAEFFNRGAPSGGRRGNYVGSSDLNYAPIEQYLR